MANTKIPPELVDDQVIGRKNIIINGDMKVYQRAQSVTGFTAAYKYYTADRMRFSSQGGTIGTWNQEVQTDQNIGDYSNVNVLKTTCTTAGSVDEKAVNYRVEPIDIKHMIGKTCTLSFYAKADATVVQEREVTGISSGSVAFTSDLGDITLTTSWTRYTATFTMANCTNYLDILLRVKGNVETSSYITLIQLELGSQATPFEFKSYGEELALCQRYCQKYGPYGVNSFPFGPSGYSYGATTTAVGQILPAELRASPTISFHGDGNPELRGGNTAGSNTLSAVTSVSVVSAGTSLLMNVTTSGTSNETGQVRVLCNAYANTFMIYDAEL
jgi:hypothetical protein